MGKGRTCGSEELVDMALANPVDRNGHPTPWLVVGETFADTRDINIEGVSGIQAALTRRGHPLRDRPPKDKTTRCHTYNKTSPPTITIWPEGQKIVCQSADDADVGRGYNFAGALLDELAKWGPVASAAWKEGIMPSLRADVPDWNPRVIVTTTPKPIKLLREWVSKCEDRPQQRRPHRRRHVRERRRTCRRRSSATLLEEYEGTRLGRQELHGELLDEVEGALWTHELIDRASGQGADSPSGTAPQSARHGPDRHRHRR